MDHAVPVQMYADAAVIAVHALFKVCLQFQDGAALPQDFFDGFIFISNRIEIVRSGDLLEDPRLFQFFYNLVKNFDRYELCAGFADLSLNRRHALARSESMGGRVEQLLEKIRKGIPVFPIFDTDLVNLLDVLRELLVAYLLAPLLHSVVDRAAVHLDNHVQRQRHFSHLDVLLYAGFPVLIEFDQPVLADIKHVHGRVHLP